MFKTSYNRAVIRLRVETVTPLSICAGDTGLDPAGSDLVCVRTHHHIHGRTVYIPGSSFKGVVRSAAEATLRSLFRDGAGACDPVSAPCSGTSRKEMPDTARVHQRTCKACRLFGSLAMRGRCAIRDMFPFPDTPALDEGARRNLLRANQVEVRHGIFIDRISGSVQNSLLFDQEMVPAGTSFYGEVALQNYQAWQLGLLCATFTELSDGFVQLGSSKSRGLGVVRVELTSLVHEQRAGAARGPLALGDLVDVAARRAYGLLSETPLPESEGVVRGLSHRFEVEGADELARWDEAGRAGLAALTVSAGGR